MGMNLDPNVDFYEEQQFRQPWLILLLVGGLLATLVAPVMAILSASKTHPNGHPVPAPVMYLLAAEAVAMALVLALFLTAKMITEVRWDGIVVRAFPIAKLRRFIPYNLIASCSARTYSPLGEYGGWGIRIGRAGKAYNVSGNQGVQLVLKTGERVLIGSQKADRLAEAIKARMDLL